jgi:hypothetical protein
MRRITPARVPGAVARQPFNDNSRTDVGAIVEAAYTRLAVVGLLLRQRLVLASSRDPAQMLTWWAAVTVAWGASTAILLASGLLVEVLGRRALRALVRLSGMLLIMMAIQMLMDGLTGYLADIPLPQSR